MTLSRWLENRWLVPHEPSQEEISDLLALVDRDLDDAAIDRLSSDWRMSIAYNAALQLATIALAAEGLRGERTRTHERAILSLQFTVGLDPILVDILDGVRRKRNQSNYARAGTTSASEAAEVVSLATELRERVLNWLEQKHPELLPE